MLNLTDIAKRIAQPSLSTITDIDDLKNLCVTYPYSQIFPLLYLSTLARHNDVRFDQELERLAYTISDRAMLYSLINTSQETEIITLVPDISTEIETVQEIQEEQEITSIQNNQETEEIQEVEESEVVEEVDEPFTFEFAPNVEVEESVVAEISDVIQTNKEIEEEITVPESVNEDLPEEIELKEPINQEPIIEEPIIKETAIEEPILEEPANKKTFEDLLTAHTLAAGYSLEKEEQRLKEIERLKKQLGQPITPSEFSEPIKIESKKSFSSWLTSNENYKQPTEEKVDVNDLISKFIEESPKIKSAQEKLFEGRQERKEFFSPTKKAKESLDDQQLPVSETLAKIFAAQGNFPKAIYAYEQLMLIIPEKKIFFAVQIKELQKKLNN